MSEESVETTPESESDGKPSIPQPGEWEAERGTKVAVIGAGAVGSAVTYASMIQGVARHYAMFDIAESKVKAEALDIAQGVQFAPVSTVEGSADIDVIKDADVVVITAGAKQKPGQSRLDLAGATINIMKSIVPKAVEQAPNAIFLMVANPVTSSPTRRGRSPVCRPNASSGRGRSSTPPACAT